MQLKLSLLEVYSPRRHPAHKAQQGLRQQGCGRSASETGHATWYMFWGSREGVAASAGTESVPSGTSIRACSERARLPDGRVQTLRARQGVRRSAAAKAASPLRPLWSPGQVSNNPDPIEQDWSCSGPTVCRDSSVRLTSCICDDRERHGGVRPHPDPEETLDALAGHCVKGCHISSSLATHQSPAQYSSPPLL